MLHRNILTDLGSSYKLENFNKGWRTELTDINFATMQGLLPTPINRNVGWIDYLSPSLTALQTAHGLNLGNLQNSVAPHGQVPITYFDSHWKYSLDPTNPSYVNPGAPYTLPINQTVSTQSENPANYVGWTTAGVNILSANNGDLNQLYNSANKRRDQLDSQGVTFQSYIWEDMLIPTAGWRKDKVTTYGTAGTRNPRTELIESVDFANLEPTGTPNTPKGKTVTEGQTRTWGVVGRLPRSLRGKLPAGLDFSVFYNNSENFRAQNRVGYEGLSLPAPKGKSKDYGVAITALDDRVSLKVTWYDTKVTDVDIPGGNPLGSNSWFLANMQAWGTATALTVKAFKAGGYNGQAWYANYAMADNNGWGNPSWETPTGADYLSSPITAKSIAAADNWLATMPDQGYFDRFGFPVNVAKAQGNDWSNAVKNWNPNNGVGGIQPANGGSVNGMNPSGTINQESKGVEFEFAAKPLKNWDLVLNVAKTNASRTGMGVEFVSWIEAQKKRLEGAAGDLRLWAANDKTYRQYFTEFIYMPYLFQKDSDGALAPEIRPWRFNLISNYGFDKGLLKGVNVGVGYRWQDKVILGYGLDDKLTKLDINRPIKGASEAALDGWVGYSRKLSSKVQWRLQLNLRNIGEKARLIPVSVNPTGANTIGTPATMRIADGMCWSLRNTFEF